MICPVCKAEYRQGFARCDDCDVELVELLPVTGDFDEATSHWALSSADQPLEKVWSGDDQQSCVSICVRLRDADIPYRVSEQNRQDLRARDQYFVTCVSPSDVQMATEIASEGGFDFDDSEEDQAIMELPARMTCRSKKFAEIGIQRIGIPRMRRRKCGAGIRKRKASLSKCH